MFAITFLKNLFQNKTGTQASKRPVRTRLAVESLEDRATPAVLFAAYGTGTYAYDTDHASWRQITPAVATHLTEGANGVMFGTYSSGTFEYNYASNSWSKLSPVAASALDASDDNTLYASFGNGTFRYLNGNWQRLTTTVATTLAAVDANHCFGSTASGTTTSGTYEESYGNFNKLTAATTHVMAADASGTLVASYGSGTYTWYNGWTQISTRQATAVTSEYTPAGLYLVDPTSLEASFSDGTYNYGLAGHSWQKVNSASTSILAREAQTGNVFGSYADGTFEIGGPKITGTHASQIGS